MGAFAALIFYKNKITGQLVYFHLSYKLSYYILLYCIIIIFTFSSKVYVDLVYPYIIVLKEISGTKKEVKKMLQKSVFFVYSRVEGVDQQQKGSEKLPLDPVNSVRVIAPTALRIDVIKLDVIVQVAANKVHSISDLDGLWELPVGLEVPSLVSAVLKDDVRFGILVVSQADKDDV